MRYIYKHEMKQYWKTLLLWSVCVGGMGMACILLYSSMREEMAGMAESFAAMGAFSAAFGMDQLSIATLKGFYATEVGTIHELGGAMFAAVVSMNILSKEEDGHTSEFLFSLPIARGKVVWIKWCVVCTNLLLFHLLCGGLYGLGFVLLGRAFPEKNCFCIMPCSCCWGWNWPEYALPSPPFPGKTDWDWAWGWCCFSMPMTW